MFETVSVIGGDLRQLTLARLLKAEGYHVFLYGFDKDETILDGLQNESDPDYAFGADIIVLPVPVTFDGETLSMPYSSSPLTIEELLDGMNSSAIVFGGQIKPNLQSALEERGIAYRDYLKREELAVRNAVPTALAVEVWISRIQKRGTTAVPHIVYFIGHRPISYHLLYLPLLILRLPVFLPLPSFPLLQS